MGGSNSHFFDQKLFLSQWQRKQGSIQGRAAWKKRSEPSIQLEQYPIFANTQHDIQRVGQLFDLRKRSQDLVSAYYLKETIKGGLCSSAAHGRLFLQKIPLKLQALQHIPFPDILHLHYNSLTGYRKLVKLVGAFRPQQQQIGFNSSGQAKVWLNGDFAASNPTSIQTSQASMVRNLLQLIQDNTDHNTTPIQSPSIINYIYQNRTQVNFDEALISVRQYANKFNNGVIPKNLQCIQRVGIENISKSLVGIKEQNGGNTSLYSSERTSFNNGNFRPQLVSINQSIPQNKALYTNYPTQVVNYPSSQVINSVPIQTPSQQFIPLNQSQHFNNTQSLQFVQQIQPLQQIQPIAQSIQPVVQRVQSNVQAVQPIPRNQILQASGVRFSNLPTNTQTISQGQTVRPIQQFVRPPAEQRVIQQVIRQVPINQPFPVQNPIIINQDPRVLKVDSISNTPVINTQNQTIVQVPVQLNSVTNVRQNSNNIQVSNNQNSVQTLQNPNKISQQVLNLNVNKFQERESKVILQNQGGQQSNSRSRNLIESNTTNLEIGKQQINYNGFKKVNRQQLNLYEANNNEVISKNVTGFQYNNYGSNIEQTSSRLRDLNLEDGKSSQALLAQLKGLSSGGYTTNKLDSYSSNNYEGSNYNNYKFDINNYGTSNYNKEDYSYKPRQETNNYDTYESGNNAYTNENNAYESGNNAYESGNVYNTFNKYARGGNNLEDNIQMKYSMTQQLYDNQATQGQNQTNQYDNRYELRQYLANDQQYGKEEQDYGQEGQYHVDYDPQILADIAKMRG